MTNLSYERAQAPFLEASKRDVGEVFGDTILVASTVAGLMEILEVFSNLNDSVLTTGFVPRNDSCRPPAAPGDGSLCTATTAINIFKIV